MLKKILSKIIHLAPPFIGTAIVPSRTAESAFTKIYETAAWAKNALGEGTSGTGSLPENAHRYIAFLQTFLKDYRIKNVVDVGCGDWELSRNIDWNQIIYQGYDVVRSVIEKNKVRFSSATIQFSQADALFTNLPSSDLLICKDVMQHLRNGDILLLLSQMHKFKHCLITNDIDPRKKSKNNKDLLSIGGYRVIDLTKPPFEVQGMKILTYRSGQECKQVLHINNTID